MDDLCDWFKTSLGSEVLEREKAVFDAQVVDLFGFYALQLGLPEYNFLSENRMPSKFFASSKINADICCDFRLLPIGSEELDLLLMPHVLDFSDNPRHVLREGYRVLRAEGHLILSVFNPWSLFGGRRLFSRHNASPWGGNFISLSRLKDWLDLLGFEIISGHIDYYLPPIQVLSVRQKFSFLEQAGPRWWPFSGGVYFLHAVKRTAGFRLLPPSWIGKFSRPGRRVGIVS